MLLNKKELLFFVFLLVIDAIMVSLHILYGQKYDFFNLDVEQNLPTYYQSFKLLFLSAMSYSLYVITKKTQQSNFGIRKFWILFTILFSYLCIDEAGQIHENTFSRLGLFFPNVAEIISNTAHRIDYKSIIWLALYAPLILLTIIAIIFFIKRLWLRYNKKIYILILGMIILISVLVLEYVDTGGEMTEMLYNRFIIAEEFAEMLGISIMIYFSLEALGEIDYGKSDKKNNRLSRK